MRSLERPGCYGSPDPRKVEYRASYGFFFPQKEPKLAPGSGVLVVEQRLVEGIDGALPTESEACGL